MTPRLDGNGRAWHSNGMRTETLLALVLASAACAGPAPKPPAAEIISANERRFYDGRVVVVEHDDAGAPAKLFSQTTVLAATPALKESGNPLFRAAFHKECGGPSGTGGLMGLSGALSLDCPTIETLDDYLAVLRDGFVKNKADYEKTNPGKAYPWPDDGTAATRAELAPLLRGRDYLVLRYVHVEESKAAP